MRLLFGLIGAALAVVGVISLLGAIELARGGASPEQMAQGFLVPVSLFVVAAFALWAAWKGRGKR